MCGIAGILDPRGVVDHDVTRMADALAHRGPDDATVHVEPGLGFGFRRLSIIDLSTGRQPIANEDRTVWVILNGEIYNYRDLRAMLEGRGHVFRTRSDTEVLVHLYEERGPDLVQALRGMFAFALWDRPRRRLLLARDHLGQKPLFWARDGGRLWFASELKAILAVAPRFRALDPLALDEYLGIRVIAEDRSMFAGVHKLPAAHLLVAEGDRVAAQRYWHLAYEPKTMVGAGEALEALDTRLGEVVRTHLVSDVPVGAFLSGGVDSGMIVGAMRREAAGDYKTFSMGLPYGRFDEAPAARAVARRYGTAHYEEAIDGSVVTDLPQVVYHMDEPSDPLSICLYRLARMTSREVKVALGGDGGDELFGGYDRYYGARYVRYYAALPRSIRRGIVRRLLDRAPDGFWYKSWSHRLRWMDELALVDGGRRYARSLGYFYFTDDLRRSLYTDAFRERTAAFDPESSLIAWYEDGDGRETLDRMLMADTMVRLPNHSVMILDRMTMAHGLEARSPFLDHEFAEFAARLPARLKVRGRRRRFLQMRLAERYLPPEVLRRPKQGFSSGLPYMMQDQFRALFERFLPDSRLVGADLLRPEPMEQLLRAHLAGRTDHGNRLWLLLNAELWYRIHIEQESPDDLREELTGLLRFAPPRSAPPVAGAATAPGAPR